MVKQRNPAMDVIRCFALFCVVSVHFFRSNGFYDEVVAGIPMFIMVLLRSFFMICVPLFIILSGYLLNKKALCKDYYKKLTQILAIYLLASMACAGYRLLFDRGSFSLMGSFWGLFAFSTAPYSWYIEMYIGLFLVIPFLNILYHNLPGQKAKGWLVLTFLLLTALPSVLNIWQFLNPQWWLRPSISENYDFLYPEFWEMVYPLTYYFIGCYLSEYGFKLKSSVNLLLILLVALLTGIFNYYRSYGAPFRGGQWTEYRSLAVTIQSVLVFHYFKSLNYASMGKKTAKLFSTLSSWCLGAYLCSWIFDTVFYKILNDQVPVMQKRLPYYPLIVPAVYVCSLLLSAVLNSIYGQIRKLRKGRRNLPSLHPK